MSSETYNDRTTEVLVDDKDDDTPTLSLQSLRALNEFLNEQRSEASTGDDALRLVSEDWRLSQFWYDKETAEMISVEIRTLCRARSDDVAVVCISCPTIYVYIKELDPAIPVKLLEYDQRFQQYGSDFTFYDYNQPEDLPLELKHAYQVIVADPPYLSRECLEKVTQTISFLAHPEDAHLLLLTGAIQEDIAGELLNVRPCNFRPQHSNKLGNEFRLFTNYNPTVRLGGWEQSS